MKNDLFHAYFSAFKMIGESTELVLFRLKGNSLTEKHPYDHADYDGISAIVDLARKNGPFTPPKINFTSCPSFWGQLKGFLRWYFRFWPFKSATWKSRRKTTRVSAWGTFPLPQGISSQDLNAKLLLSLDRASRSRLSSKRPRMWMIPVGLYERIDHSVQGGNRVSFIDVSLHNKSTTDSIKEEIRDHLKAMVHWGTLLTLKPARLFGVKLFARFLKTAHLSFRRTGTLTNMGEWKLPELAADEWWVFGDGMVARMNPLVATAMVTNGNLGVSLIAHPILGLSKDEIEKFLADWKEAFISG